MQSKRGNRNLKDIPLSLILEARGHWEYRQYHQKTRAAIDTQSIFPVSVWSNDTKVWRHWIDSMHLSSRRNKDKGIQTKRYTYLLALQLKVTNLTIWRCFTASPRFSPRKLSIQQTDTTETWEWVESILYVRMTPINGPKILSVSFSKASRV